MLVLYYLEGWGLVLEYFAFVLKEHDRTMSPTG